MTTTGNNGLDALADAIAARVAERIGQPKLMRIKDAAAYMSISRRTLEGLIASGTVPAVRQGSLVRLDRDDVDKWIQMRKGR